MLSASELLKQPAPINALAINVIQDVVESALAAVGEHVRADIKARSDFDKLFDAVVTRLGAPAELVGLRSAAVALNNARVGFKHHGNRVSEETLRRHNDVAITLVHELVRLGFNLELDDVSMLVFVSHDGVRQFLERANFLHTGNELIRAMSYLRAAFDLTLDDYANRKSVNGWDSIFDVAPRMTMHSSVSTRLGWEEPHRELRSWVEALDKRVRMAAMGVDPSRYAYFDAVAPKASYLIGEERGPAVHVRFEEVTDDHYKASYLFVLDTTIRLSTNDYNLGSLRRQARSVATYDPEFFSPEYLERQRENRRKVAQPQSGGQLGM